MSLVTRCPKCQNDFLVSPDQLSLNDGLVRCGSCTKIFDGYAHLENDLPTLTTRASPSLVTGTPASQDDPVQRPLENHASPQSHTMQDTGQPAPAVLRSRTNSEFYAEPELGQDSGQGSGFSVGWGVDPVSHEPAHHTVQGEIRARDPRVMDQGRQPDFLTADEEPGIFGNILWGLAGTLALLVLLGQGLFWYRNDIATRLPIAQPLLASLCMRLGCELSLNRHLERISIDGSTLQQVAGQTQDGLPTEMMLRFTMRNRYDMSQPWPHLSVELKDASGTTVVRKIIAPHQYLPPSLVDQAFAAGQELNLSLPVSVTGLQINGFQLDKFFP